MKILLVVSGMTPQIITETVYGLAVEPEAGEKPWVPDQIQVLTTKFGATQIRGALLGSNSPLQKLSQEYSTEELDLTKIHFDESSIEVFSQPFDAIEEDNRTLSYEYLNDIKSKEDSEIVANAICAKLKQLTADPDTEIHLSIAGGRKTMGYYAGYAMSLYGRVQDRMSHVLVSSEFENVKEFYYPTKHSNQILNSQGHYVDSKDAKVWLMNLPFVRLRESLQANDYLNSDFSETVFKINSAHNKTSISLNIAHRTVMINNDTNLLLQLSPIKFAFLWWFADLAKNQPEAFIKAPDEEVALCNSVQNYLDRHDQGRSLMFNQYLQQYLDGTFANDADILKHYKDKNGPKILDKKQFSEIKSRLKADLNQAFGLNLTEKILPLKVGNQGFMMPLESEAITIFESLDGDIETALKQQKQKKK